MGATPVSSATLDSLTTFGDLLRHLRRKARLTQREFGIAVGYSEAHVGRLESNERRPEIATVSTRFIEALDLEREPQLAARLIELAKVAHGAARGQLDVTSQPRLSNLPAQLTNFIGREREIAGVKDLLSKHRLVTLAGAGGVGKTRLAQETAADLLDAHAFADGVWFVELAALAEPALVSQAIATTLKLTGQSGCAPLNVVTDYFETKQALLVLDNCEHLIAACAELTSHVLQRCHELRILVTSRERLRVPGEVIYRVPSLSFPNPTRLPPVENLLEFEAVSLFVDRTRNALPDFKVTTQNAKPLAHVCHRLDGIPLAIELAAARTHVMQVEQIAARLDDRFRLLTSDSRITLPRHKTLRALIDWSYDLLTEAEQTVLRRLSVFAGGWTLESAEAIAGDANGDVLDMLSQLVDKSLVTFEHRDTAYARYRLLETIRQYAHERLLEHGEVEQTRDQHLKYFLHLAELAEPELRQADQIVWLDRLEVELDNFRAALEWSLEHERHIEAGLRLAAALMWLWDLRDHKREGSNWLERVLSAEAHTRGSESLSQTRTLARAQAFNAAAFLMGVQGYFTKQDALATQGLELSRKLGDPGQRSKAFALWNLACVARIQQDYSRAHTLFEESLALYRQTKDAVGITHCLVALGDIALVEDDYDRAKILFEESLVLRKDIGDKNGMANAYLTLGEVAFGQGDFAQATALSELSLALYVEVGNRSAQGMVLNFIGSVSQAQGEYAKAIRHSESALALAHEIGDKSFIAVSRYHLGQISWSQGEYEQAARLYEEALILFRGLEGNVRVAMTLRGLGDVALAQGERERAAKLYEEVLALGRNMEEGKFTIANALFGLGRVAQVRSDLTSARTAHQEALALWCELHERWDIAASLDALAAVAVGQGQVQQAARLFGAAATLYELIRWMQAPFEQDMHEHAVATVRSQLDESTFISSWAEGAAMTLDQAVQRALRFD